MARDGALPAAARLSSVRPRTGTPVAPALLSGALAIALLLLNFGNPTLFSTITGTSVVVVYLAYLLVTGPLLVQRLRGRFPAEPGRFSLGRWGVPLNGAAVVYGVAILTSLRFAAADPADSAGWAGWFGVDMARKLLVRQRPPQPMSGVGAPAKQRAGLDGAMSLDRRCSVGRLLTLKKRCGAQRLR